MFAPAAPRPQPKIYLKKQTKTGDKANKRKQKEAHNALSEQQIESLQSKLTEAVTRHESRAYAESMDPADPKAILLHNMYHDVQDWTRARLGETSSRIEYRTLSQGQPLGSVLESALESLQHSLRSGNHVFLK